MRRDKRIVVLSGASSGIGLSIADHLSRLGNIVFAGARKGNDIERLSKMKNVYGVKLDITNREDIDLLRKQIEEGYGYIDVLINNAGITGWGAIMDRDIDYFRKILEVNLLGHIQMVQCLYPLLRKSKTLPIVINVSSQGGHYAFPFWSPYHISKWGLEAFSESLRRELLTFGIRVAVIQPGAIKSEAFSSQRNELEHYKKTVISEFQKDAIPLLQSSFNRSTSKEKPPLLVAKAVEHAIYHKNNRLYYQPGRQLIPYLLLTKAPGKLVDGLLNKMYIKKDRNSPN